MGKALIDFAMQLGQGAAGAGMGMLLGAHADARQIRQQRKLQDMQIQGQRDMMDYSYSKQMQMWKDTNYGAQKQMLQEAGLNPGLLYGMGGGGGTTTGGAGTSVQGGTAPSGGGEPMQMAGMAMHLGLLRAQKENIEADTANKQADIPKKTAETGLINVQTAIADIERQIKGATVEEAIKIATAQMAILQEKVHQEESKTTVDRATQNNRIDTITAQLAAAVLGNELTRAQTTTERGKPALQAQEIESMKAHIQNTILSRMVEWRKVEIMGQGANLNDRKFTEELSMELNKEMGLPFQVVDEVIQAIILKGLIIPKPTYDPRFKTHRKTDVIK